ncbi:MAG: hypothetical protein AB7I42_23085 [Bradyrhizobium sp.]|uniref:hypothetical protein n=1 Tax=Bradyrhizobium sp. TaxID=376 RepID=UPI003D10CD4B
MKVTIHENGARELIAALAIAPEKIRRNVAREAFKVGTRAVELMKRAYRTTGGEDSTWVRSGRLRRSYDAQIARDGGDVTLTVGAIKPTDQGQVPLHARVQEGYDARGNRVEQFIIRAKQGYLTFPIRSGGGLGARSIVGWVRVKQVTLKPRPAIEPVRENLERALTQETANAVADAL